MTELTSLEQALVAAVATGELLNVTGRPEREVRAEVIRDVLLGRIGDRLDPRGLRLRGAVVLGPLDLDGMQTAVRLVGTRAGSISLGRAHLVNPDGWALAARLDWLGRMPDYAAQPYRQLAAAYQAAGAPGRRPPRAGGPAGAPAPRRPARRLGPAAAPPVRPHPAVRLPAAAGGSPCSG